jgi:hypothetical protein
LTNHFHLLIKSEPESYYSDEQVKQRIEKYMDKDKEAYAKFGGEIIGKKDRNVYRTGINSNILSLRKLIC